MIFTERTIMVVNDSATINKPLILYRGDKNIELKITIAESQFKFRNNDASNVIETTDASYAQLVINTPYNSPIFSEVAATKNGTVIFVISEAMIDEIREVGIYDIQIRLLDDDKQSRVTIPPVSNAIEIREPMAIEDGSVVDSNVVNVAKVNRALTTTSAPLEAFDSQGNYIKKTWGDGDPITDAALNKMEAGIDGVNKKVANNSSQIKDIEIRIDNIDGSGGSIGGEGTKSGVFSMCRKWNVLGDSITYGLGTTATYHAILKDKYSIPTVAKYAVSGSQISTGGTNSATSSDDSFCNRYTSMDDDADLVTVFGGINDLLHRVPLGTMDDTDGTTFYGALKLLCEGLINKYPNSKIIFFTPLKAAYGSNGLDTNGYNNLNLNLEDYIQVMKKVCNYYCIPIIDLSNICRLQPNLASIKTNYMPDGLHPNAAGHQYIANALELATSSYIIAASSETDSYSISYNLGNSTSSNSTSSITANSSYTTTITASNSYQINSITVTMGGIDISTTAVSSNVITIAEVTGNIVITVSTSAISSSSDDAIISIDATNTISGTTLTNNGTGATTYDATIITREGGSVTNGTEGIDITKACIQIPPWDKSQSWTLEMVVDGISTDDIDTSETHAAATLFEGLVGVLWYWNAETKWEFEGVGFKDQYGNNKNKSLPGTIDSINNKTIKMIYDAGTLYSLYLGDTLLGSTTYSSFSTSTTKFTIGKNSNSQDVDSFTLKSFKVYDYAKNE